MFFSCCKRRKTQNWYLEFLDLGFFLVQKWPFRDAYLFLKIGLLKPIFYSVFEVHDFWAKLSRKGMSPKKGKFDWQLKNSFWGDVFCLCCFLFLCFFYVFILFAFLFFVSLSFCFWKVCFVLFSFSLFHFAFEENPVSHYKGLFCLVFSVSLCFSLAFCLTPFFTLSFSVSLLFFSLFLPSFFSFYFVFLSFLVFISFFLCLVSLLLFH